MKKSIHSSAFLAIFFVFLLLSSCALCARPIAPQTAAESTELKGHQDPMEEAEDLGSEFISLMGLEVCKDRGDECLRRRVVSEAHLDYIYTQHLKH